MMSPGTTESRGIFSLRYDASCVYSVFLLLSLKGGSVNNKEKQCDTEEGPDIQACNMV